MSFMKETPVSFFND